MMDDKYIVTTKGGNVTLEHPTRFDSLEDAIKYAKEFLAKDSRAQDADAHAWVDCVRRACVWRDDQDIPF